MIASQLIPILEYTYHHSLGSWIWGIPGIGKTQIVIELCERLGIDLCLLPPAVAMEPVDMRGLPFLVEDGPHKITDWAVAKMLPRDPKFRGIIFADELAQCERAMQSCFTQLFAPPFRLGDYQLPVGAVPVVCSNRKQDRAGVQHVLSQLNNRFLHLDLEPEAEDWAKWMLANERPGAPILAPFVRYRPALISTFDPSQSQRAYSSPRSLEKAGKVLADPPPDDMLFPILSGIVGEGPAAEIVSFKEIHDSLQSVESIVKNPDKAPVPKETSVLYALSGALVEHARQQKNDKTTTAVITYAGRMPAEFGILTVKDAWKLIPNATKHPAIVEFARSHSDVLWKC